MLDIVGCLYIDQEFIQQVVDICDVVNLCEMLLVVDGLIGQDVVNVVIEFDDKIGVIGVMLSCMDGDGCGGVVLLMCVIIGKLICFVGFGEKMDVIEIFEV